MEKITINAGCANGWSEDKSKFVDQILNLLASHSSYKSSYKTLGRCYNEYTHETDFAKLVYTVDSSD